MTPAGVMRYNSVMDGSLIGCARCFVPPTVMSCAFDALRIVHFRKFFVWGTVWFLLSAGPLLGAPVFLAHVVYMLPVLYRPSCSTSGWLCCVL